MHTVFVMVDDVLLDQPNGVSLAEYREVIEKLSPASP